VANVHAILFDKINLRSKTEMPIAVKWRQIKNMNIVLHPNKKQVSLGHKL
jgi:hypothetical protein